MLNPKPCKALRYKVLNHRCAGSATSSFAAKALRRSATTNCRGPNSKISAAICPECRTMCVNATPKGKPPMLKQPDLSFAAIKAAANSSMPNPPIGTNRNRVGLVNAGNPDVLAEAAGKERGTKLKSGPAWHE